MVPQFVSNSVRFTKQVGIRTVHSVRDIAGIPFSILGHLSQTTYLIRHPQANDSTGALENRLERDWGIKDFYDWVKTRIRSLIDTNTYFLPSLILFVATCFAFRSTILYILWALRYLFMSVAIITTWLNFPRLLGFTLSQIVTHVALNGFPLKFEHLHLNVWLSVSQKRICCRVAADGFGFANPPEFPHIWFLTCGKVAVEASISYQDFIDVLFLRYKTLPLRKNPYHKNLATIQIDSIDFDKLMINFELWDGKFNINEFTRILAEGEMRKAIGKRSTPPNKLTINIIRAKGLVAKDMHRSGKSSDPKVVIKARDSKAESSTRMRSLDPIWGETYELLLVDPSTVVRVAILDEDVAGHELLGHWIITAKYLRMDPSHCLHLTEDFEVLSDPKGNVVGMRGWFPLLDKRMRGAGEYGSINMSLRWEYDPELEEEVIQRSKVRIGALEQLKRNSRETNLRLGNTDKLTSKLNSFPILFNISRVTIRNVEFYLQDLFRGYNGAAENLKKRGKGTDAASSVLIDCLDWSKVFKPSSPDPGITVYAVLYRFFVRGVMPSVLSDSGVLGSAVSQTSAAVAYNMLQSMSGLFKGDYDISNFRQLGQLGLSVGTEAKNVGKRMKTRLRVRAGDWDDLVDAEDLDFLQAPRLRNYFYKTSNRSRFALLSAKSLCVFELRGNIICYNSIPDCGVHRKIRMDSLQCVVLDLVNFSLTLHRKEKRTTLLPTLVGSSSSSGELDPGRTNDTARTPVSEPTKQNKGMFGNWSRKSGKVVSAPQKEMKLTPATKQTISVSKPTGRLKTPIHPTDAEKEQVLRTWFEEIISFGVNHVIVEE